MSWPEGGEEKEGKLIEVHKTRKSVYICALGDVVLTWKSCIDQTPAVQESACKVTTTTTTTNWLGKSIVIRLEGAAIQGDKY